MSTETVVQKRRRGRPPVANDTRERILGAAIEHFSRRSYEETGLREIAAAAGVDVAYVHRCFGSKKRLFADAVSAAVKPKDLFDELPDKLPGTLAWDVLATRGTRAKGLDIILNSIASREAGPIVRDFYANEVVKPLAEKLGAPVMHGAVIAALITGVATLRNVVGLASLGEPEGGDLERLLAHLIRETARRANNALEGGHADEK
ncbi:TetR/AcrR family transcriptional regulator [Methylocystis sp. L43]|jgi:AcrR family transcriptional regulator|uniref:TetR/AcrR family transcriptional regulator n=1 Tax=unclassified Methylocystis TaxID=2625913 RepID=UPI0018C334C6|nr:MULTISPECIES: TetR/AcrR family transcriptional regulator [unclassified Methylocystis]MBG0799916.1 TetR/AcrR family transcriptional regulator [Methylocystis sp. L43]MBG0807700.1 TetR/AcrR family transcriptional regulator [Methylocystis sp. H15]